MSKKVIKSYKAFDKNMQCRGFQYEVGKEYEMDGEIKCCDRGFHACKSPMKTPLLCALEKNLKQKQRLAHG